MLWKDRAVCLLCNLACILVDEFTTDSLSPNMWLFSIIGTPRYRSVLRRSIICSTQVLAATNSDPYVAVSTVACFFVYQSIGVPFIKY